MSQPNKPSKEKLVAAIADMEEDEAYKLAETMLAEGEAPQSVLDGAREAMTVISARFDKGEYYLPELIIAGEVMKQDRRSGQAPSGRPGRQGGPARQGPHRHRGRRHPRHRQRHRRLHAGREQFRGPGHRRRRAPPTYLSRRSRKFKPDVVGMSGFLTQAFDQMKRTIEAIADAGLREKVKIMIGGAIMDDQGRPVRRAPTPTARMPPRRSSSAKGWVA